MKRSWLVGFLWILVGLSSCKNDPIGTPCVRHGDGFTASHNCKTQCLSIWKIQCPDGSYGDSRVCAGSEGCERGGCPDGQVCFQTNMDRAYCVPQTICPEWSEPSQHPQVSLKELPKRDHTTMRPTAPAGDLELGPNTEKQRE